MLRRIKEAGVADGEAATSQAELFDLRATHNPHRFVLPVTPNISVGPPGKPFLFGGVALATAVSALERTTGRKVIWATAQYLSFARQGSMVDVDVWLPVQGNNITQARVSLHVNDQEIITVNAALGRRDMPFDDQWVEAPPAPPPADCPPTQRWRQSWPDLHSNFEMRLISGRYQSRDVVGRGAGRVALWARARAGGPASASTLCILGDFLPSAIADALGELAGANSLDNTIRFARHDPSEWVLLDMAVESTRAGLVHGRVRLFSERGVLLATGSQSMILRLHGRDNPEV